MTTRRVAQAWLGAALSIAIAFGGVTARAQTAVTGATAAPAAPEPDEPAFRPPHAFWDAGNIALVGGVAGSRALDFASTKHFRALGDTEWLLTNRIVDNTPLFAAIEIAGGAATVGLAYWLHRQGHHTLERWVMILHTAVTTGGAIHNYSLDPPRPAP